MNFDTPEEVRAFTDGAGRLDLVSLAAGGIGRATSQPGWRWSLHVKPIAETESCRLAHSGYVL